MSFAEATAVHHDTGGRFLGRIVDGWDIAGNANGGYLLSIAGRALADATGRPDPISVTVHYLAPGPAGPVSIDTDVLRAGRRFATATAQLHGADRQLLSVLGTFGDLSTPDPDAPTVVDGGPPDLPAPDDCQEVVPGDMFPPPFMGKVDLRLHPDDSRFMDGVRSGSARIRGWFRLADDEPLDTIALLTAVDALPPTVFNLDLPIAWVPTLELRRLWAATLGR